MRSEAQTQKRFDDLVLAHRTVDIELYPVVDRRLLDQLRDRAIILGWALGIPKPDVEKSLEP